MSVIKMDSKLLWEDLEIETELDYCMGMYTIRPENLGSSILVPFGGCSCTGYASGIKSHLRGSSNYDV